MARGCCLLLLMVSASTLVSALDLLHEKQKKVTLQGRIIASGSAAQPTTVGRSHRDYLFKIENGEGASRIVRLSYRFMYQDGDLPASFLDSAYVHSFRGVHDPSCDQRFEVLATAYLFDEHGFQFLRSEPALHFVPGIDVQLPAETVLACYVVTPQDYRGSKRIGN
jgi:hypothetical protein